MFLLYFVPQTCRYKPDFFYWSCVSCFALRTADCHEHCSYRDALVLRPDYQCFLCC